MQHTVAEGVVCLAQDGKALRNYLTTLSWPEIYAIEYVSLRQKSGQFRKIRAVLTEDEVIVAIPGYGAEWMVGGGPGNPNWVEYYRAHPEAIAESRQIVLDPEAPFDRIKAAFGRAVDRRIGGGAIKSAGAA